MVRRWPKAPLAARKQSLSRPSGKRRAQPSPLKYSQMTSWTAMSNSSSGRKSRFFMTSFQLMGGSAAPCSTGMASKSRLKDISISAPRFTRASPQPK